MRHINAWYDVSTATYEEGVHADGVETARSFGTGVAYMVGLLFDKEATTFFYNCVFNLMDSLMRFAVLHPAARELAGEGESARSDEGGRGTKGSRVRGCVHARANECKRGWWIWAREAGWQPRHTTREATRAFPMPGTTSLSHPPSLSLLPADLLRRSFAICATRTSSLLRSTVVG